MFQYFTHFTLILGIVPIIIFWVNRRKLNAETYYFLPFIIVLEIATIYEFAGTLVLKLNVTSWFWIYLFLEFFSLSYFFYRLSISKILSWFFICLFGLLYLTLTVIRNTGNELLMEGYLSTFSFITFLTFIVLWFKDLFKKLSYPSLLSNNLFYFIVGIMVYFAGTIFLFLLSDVIYSDQRKNFPAFWMLNVLFSFIFRILIIIGLWKSRIK
jgi:hypothetical protein